MAAPNAYIRSITSASNGSPSKVCATSSTVCRPKPNSSSSTTAPSRDSQPRGKMLGSTPPSSKSRTGNTNATSNVMVSINTTTGHRITNLAIGSQMLQPPPNLGITRTRPICGPITESIAGIRVNAAASANEITTAAPIPTESRTGKSNSSKLAKPIALLNPAKIIARPALDCAMATARGIEAPSRRCSRNRLT